MAFSTVVSVSWPMCISHSHHPAMAAIPDSLAPSFGRKRNIVLAMAANNGVSNLTTNPKNDIVRPAANFPPSLWGDLFSSANVDIELSDMYAKEIDVLKEEARNMITSVDSKLSDKLVLIDTIERLGFSYHFENEIQQQLTLAFNGHLKLDPEENDNLFIVALQFRLLRQHGLDAPSSIFERFAENDGELKKAVSTDINGLLSLYEASYLRRKGEEILDKAFSFTKAHLECAAPNLPESFLKNKVFHALDQSLGGTPRIESRRFISLYEEFELKNESLLRLAKLDFNFLQMLHKKELCEVTRWWKEMDLARKLPYVRDRVVECYFWALGVYYEPQHSDARIMQAKSVAILSVLDDTYDAYATIEEIELLTAAIQKWDMSEIDRLPDYMKICYRALLNHFEALDAELSSKGRSYALHYAKEAMKEIVSNYCTESKWFIGGRSPVFDEYMKAAEITCGYYCVTVLSFIGMTNATIEVFDWFLARPKIIKAGNIVARIIDDLGTYESEKERGQVMTGIEFYMKEHGVSKQVAIQQLHEIAETAWIDMNEGLMDDSVPMEILLTVYNWARLAKVTYPNYQDGYTHPEKGLKPHIVASLIDSFGI